MKSYNNISKDELVIFATNRKLQVQSTAKISKRPTRKDYIRALEKADDIRTVRFLELPPELRNKVYQELLVLHDSFTAHPQILRTCKLINNEASSTLYGDNLIEIKLYSDGVYTHGAQCGD